MKQKGYAFFDLDFTIIGHDTMALFCNFILKHEPWRIFYLFFFLPAAPFAAAKLISSRNLKRVFFTFLWKMKKEKLMSYAEDFVEKEVLPRCYPEVLEEIRRHKKEGRLLVLNTASPGIYPEIIAEKLGFDECRATRFILPDVCPLFFQVDGPNNKRFAKLISMSDLLPDEFSEGIRSKKFSYSELDRDPIIRNSWSYSDSIADFPLLLIAENRVLINPISSVLKAAAEDKLWDVIHPGSCHNAFCKFLSIFLQITGLYPLHRKG